MINNILIYAFLVSASTPVDKVTSEYDQLQQLEQRALRNRPGKVYVVDLTHRDWCNKTRVSYLGVVHTRQGRSYKILTSFFVFSASATCHGTSRIKIFDMQNRYIGEYNVGMADVLPDILKKNQLLYLKNTEGCNMRKTRSIDLSHGLPKHFFLPCSKNGGDQYTFDSGE
jgi:hypothetical protein